MSHVRPNHLAYVLRLWRAGEDGEMVWHVSLLDVRTGERLGFGSLDELIRFLNQQIDGVLGSEPQRAPEHHDRSEDETL